MQLLVNIMHIVI